MPPEAKENKRIGCAVKVKVVCNQNVCPSKLGNLKCHQQMKLCIISKTERISLKMPKS